MHKGSGMGEVLTNLFLHDTFNVWMSRRHANHPCERYADDAVVLCQSHAASVSLKNDLAQQLGGWRWDLDPTPETHLD
jgi:RNA-directed DNA polymerase